MRALLFFVLMLLILQTKSQTSVYYPFPDSNALWNEDFYGFTPGPPHCSNHDRWSFVIKGDTIINSTSYHKLYSPICDTMGFCLWSGCLAGYSGAFRQDTTMRKVWYVTPDSTNENLLYDFTLNVSDSIYLYDLLYGFFANRGYWAKVVSIDSVLIGNDYRKRWSFTPRNDTVIEGIGSLGGLLEYGYDLNYPYGGQSLNCFQRNGKTLYPDASNSCGIILSVNSISEKDISISIFPNPFHLSATIIINGQKAELKIYNILSQQMKDEIIYGRATITGLGCGIYFYKLINDKGEVASGKFIVN